jgi:hypothetical protein
MVRMRFRAPSVLFGPGEQFSCRPLALGQMGEVRPAVGQVGGGRARLALQDGERDSPVSDDDAEARVRRVGDKMRMSFMVAPLS